MFNEYDIQILQSIYTNVNTIDDIINLINNGSMVKISETYINAYVDYVNSSDSNILSYSDFVQELNKGYGNSSHVEISRLFQLSNGIWYDKEYAG